MAKFTKPFRGVKKGEIYQTQFKAGEDCPPELESAAKSLGVIGKGATKTDDKSAGDGSGAAAGDGTENKV